MAVGQVILKTQEEIELIRESALLVGKTLGEVSKLIKPGVETISLDRRAEEFIRDHGGVPAFKDYRSSLDTDPFPYTLCVSVNDEIVHGMPGEKKYLDEGDIVAVDCGVYMNGYYGDCAYTFAIGEVNSRRKRLMRVTEESLYKGLEKAVEGNYLGDISNAIQRHVELHGYTIVREMVGHGIGKNLHEPPEVPNYGRRRSGAKLKEGMVIAVEPMVNLGRRKIKFGSDGWTVVTADGHPSAHYEHTVAIGKDKCDILSSHEYIVKK
ncbi:MAG: type I methionyl aminopeptidase [Bacteroidota bacterium]